MIKMKETQVSMGIELKALEELKKAYHLPVGTKYLGT